MWCKKQSKTKRGRPGRAGRNAGRWVKRVLRSSEGWAGNDRIVDGLEGVITIPLMDLVRSCLKDAKGRRVNTAANATLGKAADTATTNSGANTNKTTTE